MTTDICLCTVPHSGTGFVREIFVRGGWLDVGLNANPAAFGKPLLYQGHSEKSGQVDMARRLAKRMPLVSSMRHPYRVEESWKRRGITEIVRLYRAYYQMLFYLADDVQLWIPVDGTPLSKHIASKQLDEIAEKHVGVDWDTLVNASQNTHAVPLEDLSPSHDIREIRAHRLFTQWYGDREVEDEVLGIAAAARAVEPDASEGHHAHAER